MLEENTYVTRLRWLVVNKREFPRQELRCEKALDKVEKQPAKWLSPRNWEYRVRR
jgi:hypothetical protein